MPPFHTTIIATDRAHLRKLVLKALRTSGPNADLNSIDVSQVTDMSRLFHKTDFVGDISRWDTSRVTSMAGMFEKSMFNGDIALWDTSQVTTMESMFKQSKFAGDISAWNVERVANTREMFFQSPFSGNLSAWRLNRLQGGVNMFKDCPFQGDMPQIEPAHLHYFGDFPIAYRGRLNNHYAHRDLLNLFKEKRWVDWYLEGTFPKRVDRVHIEKLISLQTRPQWCTDKALFKWVKMQQGICEQLGMDEKTTMGVVFEQFENRHATMVVFEEGVNGSELFSDTSDVPTFFNDGAA